MVYQETNLREVSSHCFLMTAYCCFSLTHVFFDRFCFERGHIAKSDAKGNYLRITDYPPCPFDDLWDESCERLLVPDWRSFRRIWDNHLPKLRIRPSSEDTCPECFVLKNKFKYLSERNARRQQQQQQQNEADDNENALTADGFIQDDEQLLFNANLHAEQANQQRLLASERARVAKEEARNPHEDRRFVIVTFLLFFQTIFSNQTFPLFCFSYCMICDYAQNLGLPHFGEEQPADIYYFSELTVNIFGVADVTRKPTKMLAYGYHEGEGNKGGNNVASLVMKALNDLGWLKEGREGKRLSIVMDNCGGQNKNKYVLRLALYLVELNYFKVVELIFYIRGHTKNACDRLFNQLKKRWHKQQVYTMAQVCCCFFLYNYFRP